MPNAIRSFAHILRSSGRRVTGQRRLLLDLIEQAGHHLDVPELYDLARARDPSVSLATVYRTVGLLRDLGLLDELHLGEEHHHYEIRKEQIHDHLICLGCGRVIEFSSPLVARLRSAIAHSHNFEIVAAQIEMTGYCASCRSNRPASGGAGSAVVSND